MIRFLLGSGSKQGHWCGDCGGVGGGEIRIRGVPRGGEHTVSEWQNGKMAKWQNGKMAKWQNGKMAKWQNGKMAKWQNGRSGKMEEVAKLVEMSYLGCRDVVRVGDGGWL